LGRLEVDRLTALLLQFLTREAEREAFIVEETEQRLELDIGPLSIRMQLDRVDRLADGSRVILDYKTGRVSLGGWSCERPGDPQLPAYASAGDAQGIALVRIAAGEMRYLGVGDAGIAFPGLVEPVKLGAANWAELLAGWRASLETIVQEFAGGDFRIDLGQPGMGEGQFAILTRVNEARLSRAEEAAE